MVSKNQRFSTPFLVPGRLRRRCSTAVSSSVPDSLSSPMAATQQISMTLTQNIEKAARAKAAKVAE